MRRRGAMAILLVLLLGASAHAAPAPELLRGDKLVLAKRKLALVSTDPVIGLGRGSGSADDPTMHGGTLRVLSIAGDVFDRTYALPASGWKTVKKKGAVAGWRFRGKGAVRGVMLKTGRLVRIDGGGKNLGHTLGGDPAPVRIVLTLGEQSLCLAFGGRGAFKANKRWTATGAPAPERCPLPYGEDGPWLCRPGLAHDQCLENGLDATVVHPDLTTTVEAAPAPAAAPGYDCFYVYPTVQLAGGPGNQEDVTDPAFVSLTLDPLLQQAARFRGQCRVFAPHYRQVTLSTYGSPDAARYQQIAYEDVLDAWRLYLKYDNAGRNVVVMAHSQGTLMTTRLLQEEVDPSPAARAKLVAALLIGGSVVVPDGQVVGGSFTNLPLCRSAAETGCVIAFRSYAEGYPPTAGSNSAGTAGQDTACTNPGALGGGPALLDRTYFPTHTNQPLFQVAPDPMLGTPYVEYPGFYTAECVKDDTGHSYLRIRVTPGPGDLRTNPIPFTHPALAPSFLGTHILDWSWPLGDLLTLVATKAAAM